MPGDTSREVKAAVFAHPYAPLGGSYDDPVVGAMKETLLKQGYVVGTFNFRGAGDSEGKTSWTGRPETEDYISVAGFMMYYAHHLSSVRRSSADGAQIGDDARHPMPLLLAGYSYGSLVLARLPSITKIVERFHAAAMGTAAAEIMLRARTLAKQTMKTFDLHAPGNATSRGRMLEPNDAATGSTVNSKASSVIMGGEETDSSQRRHSPDSRRSVDAVRELPHRLKAHIRQSSDTNDKHHSRRRSQNTTTPPGTVDSTLATPSVTAHYALISPVILPFSNLISPPGAPSLTMGVKKAGTADKNAGALFPQQPTLVIFGTRDTFTSTKRFLAWAEKQTKLSPSFEWEQVEGAGHFWRESGVMQALQARVAKFAQVLDQK
ncbi:hypothetical protein LTR78_004718 [Recurvomyces mirabilis]|uniref:Uncharacterized protein n=1 Tax=Recurvomyces mirabilis TaxID=574656 RepID=A0AAE0WNZ5_9PEZI|nr:hypothetical protein LTR78_004718 [Recurvomyces mirabilis]KAK5157890.1 hypothetical protein LTS14_003812 [Recurvomyces mirabilis]